MNPWLFVFLVSIILFLFLTDWNELRFNVLGGIIAALYKLTHNLLSNYLDLWEYHKVGLYLPPSFLFIDKANVFLVGIAFTMGTLYLQFLSRNLYLQFVHAFIWTLFFMILALIGERYGLITYVHFKPYMVTHVLIFFLSLAWFKTSFLGKKYRIGTSR